MSSRGDKLQALLDRVQKNRASERVVPFDEATTTPGNVMSPAPSAAKRPSPLEAALGASRPLSAAPAAPAPSAVPVRPAPAPAPHRSAAPTPIAKPTPQARPAPAETPVAAKPIAAPAPPQPSGPVATASAAKAVVEPKTFGELYARSIALRLRR